MDCNNLSLNNNDINIFKNNINIKYETHQNIDYKNKVCLKPWGYF